MNLIKSILGWIAMVFFIFGTYLKYIFILFPLLTIDMGMFVFLVAFFGLSFLCSWLPIYHLVSFVLFVIGLGDIFYYPVAYQIVYFILFVLLIIEIMRMLIRFVLLTVSKNKSLRWFL